MCGARSLLLMAIVLPACFSPGVQSSEYLLVPTFLPQVEAGKVPQGALVVGVGPVEVPRYLRRPQIVTREGNRLLASEDHRWGGEIESNIIGVLAADLGALLPTDRVLPLVSTVSRRLDYRVSVQIYQFERQADSAVVLDAYWVLLDDANEVVRSGRSLVRQKAPGSDYGAIVDAMSQTLGRLSSEIAAAIPTS